MTEVPGADDGLEPTARLRAVLVTRWRTMSDEARDSLRPRVPRDALAKSGLSLSPEDRERFELQTRWEAAAANQLLLDRYLEIASSPSEDRPVRFAQLVTDLGVLLDADPAPVPRAAFVLGWELRNEIRFENLDATADEIREVLELLGPLRPDRPAYLDHLRALLREHEATERRRPYRVDTRRDSIYTAQLMIGTYVEIAHAPETERQERLERLMIDKGRLVESSPIPLPKEAFIENWSLHHKVKLDDLDAGPDDIRDVIDMLTGLGMGEHRYVRWLRSLLA